MWFFGASLVTQMAKNLLAMQETQVQSLGWGRSWRREWLLTPILLPGEFHAQKNLAGYSPWCCKESDMTESLQFVAVYKIIIVYKNDYGDIAGNIDLKILQMSENIK